MWPEILLLKNMNTLSIKDLNLVYPNGHEALTGINLEIKNGMFGLLGPNGAGKSSLMKSIVGLQRPTLGSILFNEKDIVKNPSVLKKHLGFLPQDFGVYPKIALYDLLEHIAIIKGISNANQRKAQILNLLERVNLLKFVKKEVNTFSGGMKQRFGVAQALLGNPKVVIVDEPTAGLDPEERNRFNTLLSEISSEVIVVLSTHLVEDVRNLCSEMAIMDRGKILLTGKPKELLTALENTIWVKKIERAELDNYQSKYKVISNQLIEKELHITIVSDSKPEEDFEPVKPALEHVYFNSLYTKPAVI